MIRAGYDKFDLRVMISDDLTKYSGLLRFPFELIDELTAIPFVSYYKSFTAGFTELSWQLNEDFSAEIPWRVSAGEGFNIAVNPGIYYHNALGVNIYADLTTLGVSISLLASTKGESPISCAVVLGYNNYMLHADMPALKDTLVLGIWLVNKYKHP